MRKFISEDVINSIIANEQNEMIRNRMYEIVHNSPRSDVIPVDYILEYASRHDAVCEMNLKLLIDRFKEGKMYE